MVRIRLLKTGKSKGYGPSTPLLRSQGIVEDSQGVELTKTRDFCCCEGNFKMADARSTSNPVVPLDGSNYNTWKIQCRMALMKENLWSIVSGTEVANKLSVRRKLDNLRLQDEDSVKDHVKSMTEIFKELAVIGAPIEEEDKVVALLASLPDKFNMLVTALEANSEVPSMEIVTERLFHEENKLKERESVETSPERMMLGKQCKDPPKCYHCGKSGHLKRNCWSLKKEKEQENKESKFENHKANVVTAESNFERLGLMTQVLAAIVCINDVCVINSGAACHMTSDRSLLRDIQELTKPIEVQLGVGKVVNATARGTVFLYTILPGGERKIVSPE